MKTSKKNTLTKKIALLLASLSIMTACGKPKTEEPQKQNNANNENNTSEQKQEKTEEKAKGSEKTENKENKNEQKSEERTVERKTVNKITNAPKVATKKVVNRNLGTKQLAKRPSNQEALKRQRDLLAAREREEANKKLLAEKERKEKLAKEEARKAEEARKQAELAKKKAEEEAKKKAEELKKQKEEEAKKKAEEAKKKAEEEAKKKAEEEAKKKAEEEAKKKAEEEAKKKKEEAEKKLAEELKKAKVIATETVNKLKNIETAKYITKINNAKSIKELDEIVASAIDESNKNTSIIDEEEKKKLQQLQEYRNKAIDIINKLKNIDDEKQSFANRINMETEVSKIDSIVKEAEKLSAKKTKEIEEAITEVIEEVTEKVVTPIETVETTSDELEEGKTQVIEGQEGIKEITYKLTYNVSKKHGKVLVSKVVVKEEIKQQMKKKVIIRGTKKVDNTKYVNISELEKLIDKCDSEVGYIATKYVDFQNNKEVKKAQNLFDKIVNDARNLAKNKEKLTENEFNDIKTKLIASMNNVKETYERVIKEASAKDKDVTVRMSDTENKIIRGHYEEQEALEHIKLINKHRNYAKDLEIDEDLMRIARIRAAEISQLFEHTRVDGKSLDTLRKQLGENIAMSSGDADAKEVFEQFKESSAHNRNMLYGRYKKVGVAIFRLKVENPDGTFYYQTYTVQVFAF